MSKHIMLSILCLPWIMMSVHTHLHATESCEIRKPLTQMKSNKGSIDLDRWPTHNNSITAGPTSTSWQTAQGMHDTKRKQTTHALHPPLSNLSEPSGYSDDSGTSTSFVFLMLKTKHNNRDTTIAIPTTNTCCQPNLTTNNNCRRLLTTLNSYEYLLCLIKMRGNRFPKVVWACVESGNVDVGTA